MDIEPAKVNQIRQASHGRMVEIDQDAGNVAADLRAIDPGLGVRFAENGNPPFWAVYHQSDDNRSTYLVLTVEAHQTNSGVWTGLDQRVVKRIMEIGHSSYDYAAELARVNEDAAKSKRDTFRETIGGTMEQAGHALRKDLGLRYKGRAFIPKP